jgi:predicted alpha/beta superfamily hydrolase
MKILKSTSFLLLAIISLQITSCKKEKFDVELTKEFEIHSNATQANYAIRVGLPSNYRADVKYPTIYVLDGETDFAYVANQCKEISENKGVQNVIVVGIGYGNDRNLDYTPTEANEGSGGAEQFMGFIKNELIPKMEQDYSSDTSRAGRVILGHSFGGLLGAYALTRFNNVFGNYLILSPSLWYDNEVLLRYEQDSRPANAAQRQLVFMGIGKLENSGRMQVPFEAFYQKLNSNYQNIKLTKNVEKDLDHMGSKAPNIKEGLCFYFNNRQQ